MSATLWLLIAVSSGHSSPSTLAILNDASACRSAAAALYAESKDRTGSPYIYSYCVPVQANTLVSK